MPRITRGHKAVPIPPTYDPQEVIDVILRLAAKPEDEVVVGGAGKASAVGHNLAPHLTEAMMAKQTHAAQMEDAEQAEDTPGSLREPSMSGVGVTGGLRD